MPTSLHHFAPLWSFQFLACKSAFYWLYSYHVLYQDVSGLLVSAGECRLSQALSWPGLPSASPTTAPQGWAEKAGQAQTANFKVGVPKNIYKFEWGIRLELLVVVFVLRTWKDRNRQVKSILGHLHLIMLSTSWRHWRIGEECTLLPDIVWKTSDHGLQDIHFPPRQLSALFLCAFAKKIHWLEQRERIQLAEMPCWSPASPLLWTAYFLQQKKISGKRIEK